MTWAATACSLIILCNTQSTWQTPLTVTSELATAQIRVVSELALHTFHNIIIKSLRNTVIPLFPQWNHYFLVCTKTKISH